MLTGLGSIPHKDFFASAPLSEIARKDIVRIYTEKVDNLQGLTPQQKKAMLAKTSYADFLTKIANGSSEVIPVFQTRDFEARI